MPLRMRRKTRGMEKVENLYCTARAQHVMPQCRDHVAASGAANRFKPSRLGLRPLPADRGDSESQVRHPGVESIWAREARCAICALEWRTARPAASSVVAMQDSGQGAVSRSRRCGPCRTFGLARPLVRYESIRPTELYEYCAGIAPIAPSPAQRSPKFDPYPAKLLAMQRAAP
jgi:hypothetical protein